MADMFFEVHRSALNEAIATVFPAVDTRSKIPVLECILIECDGDALHLRASNLDLQIDASCELLAAHKKCAFALPGRGSRPSYPPRPRMPKLPFAPASCKIR